MRHEHSQILDLLASGRIDAAEAERLLALTGITTGLAQRLLNWLPIACVAAFLIVEHSAALQTALQFLTLRASEAAQLEHFHALLPR